MKSPPDPNPLWLHNGEYREATHGILSAAEIGGLNGAGVFETIPLYYGSPFALEDHWQRLVEGANRFGLPCPTLESLARNIADLAERNGVRALPLSRARITLLAPLASESQVHEVLEIRPPPLHPPEARIITLPFSRNERGALSGIKTISYGENAIALREAKNQGADEAIFPNTMGHLCEGIWTNVFVRLEGHWLTPPLSSGCLPGVTRKHILQLDPEIEEREIGLNRLKDIDAAFLTSSMRGIQPVSTVDGRELNSSEHSDIVKWSQAYEDHVSATLR